MKHLFRTLAIAFVAQFFCININAQDIIPMPNHYEKGNGIFLLKDNVSIGYTDTALKDAAQYLGTVLRESAGVKVKTQKKCAVITLTTDKSLASGEYKLDVTPDYINIIGGDYKAVVYAIQTLRQLQQADNSIAACTVKDAPRFEYRGIELDVSRHFYTVAEVKKLLDVMALYKMSKFHWHLTDDQGWRIEIKRYPKLTEKGAWRKLNNHDRECLRRADTEDNDDMRLPTDRMKEVNGETVYGGYYTQKEIREIVEYARIRSIDVLPEIDMPGHMLAAIENYEGVSCFKEIGWGKVFSSPACPGKDSAMQFCKNIYDEIIELFPYNYVHIGGDEVDKKNWKTCPDCQNRIKSEGLKNVEELQSWFIHEMEKHLNSKGKKMIGWNEIIEGGLSETSTVMWWGSWVKDVPEVTTANGNDLIFTPNSHFYLDYNEGKDNLKSIYNFDMTAGLPKDKQKHLLGVQGNIWCEFIPSVERMFYMTTTRLMAIAELGWTAAEPKNYHEFETRLINQLPRLRKMGVNYKIMALEGFNKTNAFVGEGRYNITCKDPSATIRYTTDGTMPDATSPLLSGEIVFNKTTDVIFRTFHENGRKGDIVKAKFINDTYTPAISVSPTKNGLKTVWHEFPGIDCNEIEKAPVNETFFTSDVCIPEGANGNIGLITTGYIYIPADGVYTFVLTSDDGSDLYVGDVKIVDMNREQSPETEVGEKALKKGYHKIRVRYFDHNGGTLQLIVKAQDGRILDPKELYYN